jgi:hypothetical protein
MVSSMACCCAGTPRPRATAAVAADDGADASGLFWQSLHLQAGSRDTWCACVSCCTQRGDRGTRAGRAGWPRRPRRPAGPARRPRAALAHVGALDAAVVAVAVLFDAAGALALAALEVRRAQHLRGARSGSAVAWRRHVAVGVSRGPPLTWRSSAQHSSSSGGRCPALRRHTRRRTTRAARAHTLALKAVGSRCSTRCRSASTASARSGTLQQSAQLQPWQYTPAARSTHGAASARTSRNIHIEHRTGGDWARVRASCCMRMPACRPGLPWLPPCWPLCTRPRTHTPARPLQSCAPAAKHTQYSLRHLAFLQLQRLYCVT